MSKSAAERSKARRLRLKSRRGRLPTADRDWLAAYDADEPTTPAAAPEAPAAAPSGELHALREDREDDEEADEDENAPAAPSGEQKPQHAMVLATKCGDKYCTKCGTDGGGSRGPFTCASTGVVYYHPIGKAAARMLALLVYGIIGAIYRYATGVKSPEVTDIEMEEMSEGVSEVILRRAPQLAIADDVFTVAGAGTGYVRRANRLRAEEK